MTHKAPRLARGLFAALALAAQPALAQTSSDLPLWELGAFGLGVSQQAYPGSDAQLSRSLVLPYLVYRGEYFRADRNTAGIRAVKTERFELDIGVAGSFASRADEVWARRGMSDLGTFVEFGPRLRWNLGQGPGGGRWRLELPLRGVFDLNDGAAHRGMAFEPELKFQRRTQEGWFYSAGLSAILADKKLARTLYAVDPAFALADRPAYAAQSGLVAWRVSASLSRELSRQWRVVGFGRIDSVGGAANEDSPLVRRNTGASVGIGLAYTLYRSQRSAAD